MPFPRGVTVGLIKVVKMLVCASTCFREEEPVSIVTSLESPHTIKGLNASVQFVLLHGGIR